MKYHSLCFNQLKNIAQNVDLAKGRFISHITDVVMRTTFSMKIGELGILRKRSNSNNPFENVSRFCLMYDSKQGQNDEGYTD